MPDFPLHGPDLDFRVTGVEPAFEGLTPLLLFDLEVTADVPVHAVLLQTQIRFEPNRRRYTSEEKEKLADLFGEPERWGQTLRNRLWTFAPVTTRAFSGTTTVQLPVPCTFDLNLASAKYLYALEEGDVPLVFLFSGTVFYPAADGRLQVGQVSWEKEAEFRLPVRAWQDLMEHHYPGTGWLTLPRDLLDRLYAYKRRHGLATMEQAVERLMDEAAQPVNEEVAP